jgi:hypothetical protein
MGADNGEGGWPKIEGGRLGERMRPRTRLAVSGVRVQIGSSTRSTSAVSIAATGRAPMSG